MVTVHRKMSFKMLCLLKSLLDY